MCFTLPTRGNWGKSVMPFLSEATYIKLASETYSTSLSSHAVAPDFTSFSATKLEILFAHAFNRWGCLAIVSST